MKFTADLHIHSRFSRACSSQLKPEVLYRWCQIKGVNVLATGDFTHPEWFKEIRENLVEAGQGFF
jgi:PHP family Zn ribbon phosphoesterase